MADHELNSRKMSQSMYHKNSSQLVVKKKGTEGKGGKFVRIEGAKFDIILNILIGIRRSLQNLVHLPGVELSEW